MSKEVHWTRKKETLSGNFVLSSHDCHGRPSVTHNSPSPFVSSLVFDSSHVTTKEYWCPKIASSIQYGYSL